MHATESSRKREEMLVRLGEEHAERQLAEKIAFDEKRKKERKESLMHTTQVQKEQMVEKLVKKDLRKQEDAELRQKVMQAAMEEAEQQKRVKGILAKQKKSAYGSALKEQMAEREASKSPKRGAGGAEEHRFAASLVLHTRSSDMDTEAALKREALMSKGGYAASRNNASDSIAPLLGFEADFVTAIEQKGESGAKAEGLDKRMEGKDDDELFHSVKPHKTFLPPPAQSAPPAPLGASKRK